MIHFVLFTFCFLYFFKHFFLFVVNKHIFFMISRLLLETMTKVQMVS